MANRLRGMDGLERLQRELAAILMDEAARLRWQADPRAYAKAAGLNPRDAKLLAGMVPGDVAYYAGRRWVDRWSFLQGDLPRSVALARKDGCLYAYFRAEPYPFEDTVKEATRFSQWLAAERNAELAGKPGATPIPCLLPDLAAYEAAVSACWRIDPPQARAEAMQPARPKRRPGVALLTLDHDFFDQLESPRIHDPPHATTHLALVRRPGTVAPFKMDEPDHLLVKLANGKRTEAQLLSEVQRRTGATAKGLKASLGELRNERLL